MVFEWAFPYQADSVAWRRQAILLGERWSAGMASFPKYFWFHSGLKPGISAFFLLVLGLYAVTGMLAYRVCHRILQAREAYSRQKEAACILKISLPDQVLPGAYLYAWLYDSLFTKANRRFYRSVLFPAYRLACKQSEDRVDRAFEVLTRRYGAYMA